MQEQARVAVLGGGAFGTVLANLMALNGADVTMWVRHPETAEAINTRHENPSRLPGYQLTPGLRASIDAAHALQGAEVVLVAVPSASFRAVMSQLRPQLGRSMLVSTTKGIELGSFRTMGQLLRELCPAHAVGALSGPNLAREIASGQLTGTVVASDDATLVTRLQGLLGCRTFRVYASTDWLGVELGGALKNIYAIASGLNHGLGMGDNSRSLLITRSLSEMTRFAVAMGARAETLSGLAGVGDLMATCLSPLSRNFQLGCALARGQGVEQACAGLSGVAEGVNTLRAVKEMAERRKIRMPLVQGLHNVVFGGADIMAVVQEMMTNEPTTDVDRPTA